MERGKFNLEYFTEYIGKVLSEVQSQDIFFSVSSIEDFERTYSEANYLFIKVYEYLYNLQLIRLEFKREFSNLSFQMKQVKVYENFNNYLNEAISLLKLRYETLRVLLDSIKSYTFYIQYSKFR